LDGSVNTGGFVSCTVTVNDAVDLLPCASVDEQFTVVVPNVKMLPDAGIQITGSVMSTMSVAEVVKVATAPLVLVASNVTPAAGTVSVGAMVSCTVTVKDAVPLLLCASVEEQFTVVVVMAKVVPEAGAQVTLVAPSIGSSALTLKVTGAPFGPVA
jgi:hypothetical protein